MTGVVARADLKTFDAGCKGQKRHEKEGGSRLAATEEIPRCARDSTLFKNGLSLLRFVAKLRIRRCTTSQLTIVSDCGTLNHLYSDVYGNIQSGSPIPRMGKARPGLATLIAGVHLNPGVEWSKSFRFGVDRGGAIG